MDDCNLLSTSILGLQVKVERLIRELRELGLCVNPAKSTWVELGYPRTVLDNLITPSATIARVRKICFNGHILDLSDPSDPAWPVNPHLSHQYNQAAGVAAAISANTGFAGISTPYQQLQLYKQLVAAHFVFGAETAIHPNAHWKQKLEVFEKRFLRRIMGVGPSAPNAILYHDSGLLPISLRRLQYAVRLVAYANAQSTSRLVRQAIGQSVHNFGNPEPFSGTTWFAQYYWALLDEYGFNPQPHLDAEEANRHLGAMDHLFRIHQTDALTAALEGSKG